QIRVELDPEALAARRTAPLEVAWAFDISNKLLPAGDVQVLDQNIVVEAGDFIHSAAELGKLVINVIDGVPVYLDDVARMTAWKLSAALKPANKLLSPNSDFIDTKGGTGTREAKQKSS
ncbi:MAG: efflux RND transporter permease subunit, partial [Deltaproteobacteria bacterium]|nr:efflux RND transporter permease subunit [Deltaproteobacteria bacterium]